MLKFMINLIPKEGRGLGIALKKLKLIGVRRKKRRGKIFGIRLRGLCAVVVGIMWRSWRKWRWRLMLRVLSRRRVARDRRRACLQNAANRTTSSTSNNKTNKNNPNTPPNSQTTATK